MTHFADVKPFPDTGPIQTGLGHNRPPLDEQVVSDFEEALAAEGLRDRIDALVSAAARCGDCTDEEKAGRGGDFIKQCAAAAKAIEAEREKLNRPLLNAQRALKGRADTYTGRLQDASASVRRKVDAFMAEQRRIAEEKRRLAEEQARKAAEAAAKEAAETGAPVAVEIEPVKVEAPVVQGDYGKVTSTTVWRHEIVSVRQLPDHILKHEKVIAALDQVIGAMVRSGTREMKGVRIWSEQKTVIR